MELYKPPLLYSAISTWINQLRAADANFTREVEAQQRLSLKTPQKQKMAINFEYDQILLYPFMVVGHVLNEFNPVDLSMESVVAIRQQMLHLGIIKMLLKQLTRQALQPTHLAGFSVSAGKQIIASLNSDIIH
jgi:hypothetical protein